MSGRAQSVRDEDLPVDVEKIKADKEGRRKAARREERRKRIAELKEQVRRKRTTYWRQVAPPLLGPACRTFTAPREDPSSQGRKGS